jgi:predicted N-acetyltransferase YhbS
VDDAGLRARQHRGHLEFYDRFAERIERPGGTVVAAVTRATPDRSLPNAVLYEDQQDVLEHYDALAALYAGAGVRAWTVWVRPGDEPLAEALGAAGHAHDGQPMLMGAALAEIDHAGAGAIAAEPCDDWAVVGAINDRAYGLAGGFAPIVARYRAEGARAWLARVEGEPAACVGVLEVAGDAYVNLVATLPEARGRGLCAGLMRAALLAAGERGCTTTTLEGSPMGEPVYRRLGYRSLGRFGLWERRVRNESA